MSLGREMFMDLLGEIETRPVIGRMWADVKKQTQNDRFIV